MILIISRADSVLVTPEEWLKCRAKWPRHHRPKPVGKVFEAMKTHLANFPFSSDSDPNDNAVLSNFEAVMGRTIGVKLVLMDNSGPDGFFEAFCFAFFGGRWHSDFINQIRGQVCAYVVQFWEMPAVRDMVMGSFKQFVNSAEKTFDLYSCLEVMSNNAVWSDFRRTEQVEVHCLGMLLNCEICTLTLLRDGNVSRKRGGDIGSTNVVYVARDHRHHYYALSDPTNTQRGLPSSATKSSSNHIPLAIDEQACHEPSPQPIRTISASVELAVAAVNSGGQFPQSSVDSQTTSVIDDWGERPPENSDVHLRTTWPETEKVLRSLNLFNGIWTDAQHLQQTNWIHRVCAFILSLHNDLTVIR